MQGHLVHIDFGFMLSNSPGGVSFERAPFKLTAAYMEILSSDVLGSPSPALQYFKVRPSASMPHASMPHMRTLSVSTHALTCAMPWSPAARELSAAVHRCESSSALT
jgi:hypothetical protein